MSEQAKPIVQIRDVSVRYPNGVMALDGINIDVNQNDLIALLGPNPSKSDSRTDKTNEWLGEPLWEPRAE
jgi:ABC-type phosphate transport system ATPase subunit